MVVMERLKCSVHELIHNPDFCLTVPLCLQISHEIAIGIAFLHRNSVMHRVSGGGKSRTYGSVSHGMHDMRRMCMWVHVRRWCHAALFHLLLTHHGRTSRRPT